MQHNLEMNELAIVESRIEWLQREAELLKERIKLLKAATKGGKGKVEETDDEDDDTDSDDDADAPAPKKGKATAKGKAKSKKDDDEDLDDVDDPSDEDDKDDDEESDDGSDEDDDLDETLGKGPGKKAGVTDDDIRKVISSIIKNKGAAGKKKVVALMTKYTKNATKQVKDIFKGKHAELHAALKKV